MRGDSPTTITQLVMVVDDDAVMCEFLRAFLAERGYDAVTLSTPSQAIARYQTERPAAVILDMAFPGGMDGLEALAAFKKIDRDVRSSCCRARAAPPRWSRR